MIHILNFISDCLFLIEHFIGRKNTDKIFGRLEKFIDSKQQQIYNNNIINHPFKIIDLAAGEYTKPYVDKKYPVILRGAAKDWNCCKEWDIDYFKNNFGDYEVTLQDNIGVTDRDNPQVFSKLTMSEYIDNLKAGSKKYLKFSRVIKDENILAKFFNTEWLTKFKRWCSFSNTYYFFIGGKDTKTPIHNGYAATVFIQIYGQKKWIFYPPSDKHKLKVRPERRSYYYSNADPHKENDVNYPLLKYTHKFEITLNEGDVLWFPPLVWHQVENLTDSIGVAYKFVDIPLSFKSSPLMASLFYLSTKPSIFTMFLGNRTEDNDYIFVKDKEEFKYKQQN